MLNPNPNHDWPHGQKLLDNTESDENQTWFSYVMVLDVTPPSTLSQCLISYLEPLKVLQYTICDSFTKGKT